MSATATKTVDNRGRVSLGQAYANQLVIVQTLDDGEIRVIPAQAVPAREAWLWKNPKALGKVLEGLEQAKAGKLADGPKLPPAGEGE